MPGIQWSQLPIELCKAVITTVVALVTAWRFGLRVTTNWNLRQKRREGVLAASSSFNSLYGRFFTLGKQWNAALRSTEPTATERKATLLAMMLQAEGELEALALKMVCECQLDDGTVDDLERFREGYQELRRCMWEGEVLPWFGRPDGKYERFKVLATRILTALASDERLTVEAVAPVVAERRMLALTSNRHQLDWWIDVSPAPTTH